MSRESKSFFALIGIGNHNSIIACIKGMEIKLAFLIGCIYYFVATTTGRRALSNLCLELKALSLTFSKPERCYSPAVGLVSGMRYHRFLGLLRVMTAIAFYFTYGLVKAAYNDPHPIAKLVLIAAGGLIGYVLMGNKATLDEIKNSPWCRTQRMFEDF